MREGSENPGISRRWAYLRSLGWKVHMRCANDYRQETRSIRKCVYRKQLDLETLVATRRAELPTGEAGRAFDVPSFRKQESDGGL
jgi:hypothetical protein